MRANGDHAASGVNAIDGVIVVKFGAVPTVVAFPPLNRRFMDPSVRTFDSRPLNPRSLIHASPDSVPRDVLEATASGKVSVANRSKPSSGIDIGLISAAVAFPSPTGSNTEFIMSSP